MSVMLVQDNGIRRRACERCHRQKLACRRNTNNESCLRCVRANVLCVSGPPRSLHRATPSYMRVQQAARQSPPRSTPYDAQIREYAGEHFSRWPTGLLHIHPELDLNVDFAPNQTPGEDLASVPVPATTHLSPSIGVDQILDGHIIEQPQDSGPRRCLHNMHGTQHSGSLTLPGMNLPQPDSNADPTATNLESNGSMPRDSWWKESLFTSPTIVSNPGMCSNVASSKEGDLITWISKLSQLNIELHRIMHSIPPIGVWQEYWTNPTGPNAAQINEEKDLAIDRTMELSNQYIEILNHVFPYFRSAAKEDGNTLAALSPLSEPPQLLVLSCYSCLIESYDKILQHIKACANIRLEMDVKAAEALTPIALPGLCIGTFEIAPSSSMKIIVLMHIMEIMMARVRRLINEMTQPTDVDYGNQNGSLAAKTGKNTTGIARASLQDIGVKEKAIVELMGNVRELAVQCKIL
ncbi:hypothetical protein GGI35DRAFT_470180 [Trichoderma velutinum]